MFPRVPLPERIGAYRVLRRLPSPGGSDLYLGREEGPLGFSRTVTLKLAPLAGDADRAQELGREAAAVARLNHPAIVRMFNFFEEEDRLVLVLERVEGTTLARVLAAMRRRGQQMPDEVVFYVAHRLASAVAHAHAMLDEKGARTPVIHRAITPSAVIVGWDGTVRLSGYGLSKIMGLSPDTALGLVKGAPGYMAPEQMRGERVTERVDVYQTGLVIWEMLSGNPPPTANLPRKTKQAELVQMMSGNKLAPVSMVRPGFPREIAAIIDGSLEPSVDKRTITAAEMERWLSKTVDTEGGRDALRQRAMLVRAWAARAMPSLPEINLTRGGVVRGRRVALPRFPGNAVRATGRPSLVDDSELTARPPTRRPPPVRPSVPPPRSMRPPPGGSLHPAPMNRPSRMAPAPGGPSSMSPPRIDPQAASGAYAAAAAHPQTQPGLGPSPYGASGPPAYGGGGSPSPPGVNASDPSFAPVPMRDAAVVPAGNSSGALVLPEIRPSEDTLVLPRVKQKKAVMVVAGAVGGLGLLALVGALVATRTKGEPEAVVASSGPARSAQPEPPPVVEPPPPPPPPAEPKGPEVPPLSRGMAALYVKPDVAGNVFVNGRLYGETGKPLVVPCGSRFVRIGALESFGGRTVWLTKGETIKLPCGKLTEMAPPPPLPPTKLSR